jgi:hypothetical protein
VWVFLGRALKVPQVSRVESSSGWKFANLIKVTHRDQVEAPLTDWLSEAYAFVQTPAPRGKRKPAATKKPAGTAGRTKKSPGATAATASPAPASRAGTPTGSGGGAHRRGDRGHHRRHTR